MLQVAQSPVETVYATGHSHKAIYRRANDPDQILIALKFKNGIVGSIDFSRNSCYGYDQRFEVFTLNGIFEPHSFHRNHYPKKFDVSFKQIKSIFPFNMK